MLAIALAVLSAGLIAQTLLMMKVRLSTVKATLNERAEHRNLYLRAFGMIAIGASYLVLVPYLGYILTIGLLLLTVAFYNGKRPSAGLFLFAALGSAFFYVLFVQILAVPLPAGFWPRLIG
jgi:cell division protein FtsW (lipid II flippase)